VTPVSPASNPEQERAELRAAVDGDGGAAHARVFPTAEGMVEPLTLEDVNNVQSELEAAISQVTARAASPAPKRPRHAKAPGEMPVKFEKIHSVGPIHSGGTSTVPTTAVYDARR
jgi:hypothetical protein